MKRLLLATAVLLALSFGVSIALRSLSLRCSPDRSLRSASASEAGADIFWLVPRIVTVVSHMQLFSFGAYLRVLVCLGLGGGRGPDYGRADFSE